MHSKKARQSADKATCDLYDNTSNFHDFLSWNFDVHNSSELFHILQQYGYELDWIKKRYKVKKLDSEDGLDGIKIHTLCTDNNASFLMLVAGTAHTAHELEAVAKNVLEKNALIEIGGWSDGTSAGTRFLRPRRRSGGFDNVSGPAPIAHRAKAIGSIQYSIGSRRSRSRSSETLRPVDDRFEKILFEAHSALRDIDGLHPDEALDELCKLIYAKMFDEERACSESGALRFQHYPYSGADELATAIRYLYDEACKYDTRVFSLKIAGYQRSRGVFSEPLKLSGAAIHQAVRIFQSLSFLESDVDIKGRAFQQVLGPTFRGGLGQYFTPHGVIDFLVSATAPTVDDLILDPFCGSGHFLASALESVRRTTNGSRKRLLPEFAFGKLHGIEVSARMVRVAMTDMRLQGDGHSNIRCADALLPFTTYGDLAPETFDVVLTNPPFGSLLGRDALARLGSFELAKNTATPLELLGLERSVQFLRPGGRLGIVLPESVLTNRKAQFVREWIQSQLKLRAIVGLPNTAFAYLGANIKTCLLVARKWSSGDVRDADHKVWLAEIDDIGIDATGRATDRNDIGDAKIAFSKFIKEHGW